MEELDPHSTDEAHILEDHPNSPNTAAATYVVQVPKDQIYRVPPPENAAIAERRRRTRPAKDSPSRARRSRPCGPRCCCCAATVLGFLAAGLLLLLSASLRPELPVFAVERLASGSAAAYEVRLRAENPNARLDMSYGGGSGVVSLRAGRSEVAAGKFPAFRLEHGSSAVVEIVLRGSAALAADGVWLEMRNLAARTEVLTWNIGTVEFDVSCDVAVDSLAPRDNRNARVLSQDCRATKRV